jgi:hypothetical protein
VLAPWVIRNQVQFGRPIVSTTHGGYTLWLANNAELYDHLRTAPWGSLWNADEFNRAWYAERSRTGPADELSADRLAYSRAREAIRFQPEMFAYSCMVRVARLWTPLPHQLSPDEAPITRMARYAVAVWYTVELLLAAVGVVLLVQAGAASGGILQTSEVSQTSEVFTGWLWGLLLVVCFVGVHTLYWTDMRMRAPLVPVVTMAAAAGVAGLVGRLRRPK